VLLLDDGAVIADGTHAELLAREPRYTEVLAQIEPDDELVPNVEGSR
jgi:ATP-binding cassette, subfamily B, bacterial